MPLFKTSSLWLILVVLLNYFKNINNWILTTIEKVFSEKENQKTREYFWSLFSSMTVQGTSKVYFTKPYFKRLVLYTEKAVQFYRQHIRNCFTQKLFPAPQQDARYFWCLEYPVQCRWYKTTPNPTDLFAVYNPIPFILFMLCSFL